MRILSGFTVFFYTLAFLIIGCALIASSLNIIPQEELLNVITYSYNIVKMRVAIGAIGLLLIIYSLLAVQIAFGNIQREKTIAFDNPSGRVTISLSAIEDFIKRAAMHIEEVKDLRANVIANKKGIHITNRIVIYSDVNLPDTTEKIQSILKNKMQEMLGIEEPINIKVHIAKIVEREASRGLPR